MFGGPPPSQHGIRISLASVFHEDRPRCGSFSKDSWNVLVICPWRVFFPERDMIINKKQHTCGRTWLFYSSQRCSELGRDDTSSIPHATCLDMNICVYYIYICIIYRIFYIIHYDAAVHCSSVRLGALEGGLESETCGNGTGNSLPTLNIFCIYIYGTVYVYIY